ncbi:MAG TPA: redoxin domain-containing protein [Candidatus Elarobacter sp.]|nr:redoxin domain-containing protein [Candidatus Elarobacter sp.]
MTRRTPWLLASALVFGSVPLAAAAEQLPGPVVGRPAPAFTLTTVDGKTVRLSDYRGKTLVINVWGSWCPPCRLETPDLIAEAKGDASHRVVFLGVDTTENAGVVRAFAAAKGIPYPQVATTSESEFAKTYEIRNYPTTFVIGPDGVLRARHADNILPRAQLHAYIAAAQRGETAPLTTAFQAQLDTLLDPAKYPFAGDPAAIRAAVAKAVAAIAQADDDQDAAMNDAARDHDLLKTQQEQETLRAAAIDAFAPVVATDADRALLARLRGDEASALGKWADADAMYAEALRLSPGSVDALSGEAYAVSHLGDDRRVAAIDAQIAQAAPSYASYVSLGRALAKTGDLKAAEDAFEKARTLAVGNPARVAWTNLYYGRMETAAGNREKARAAFARAGDAAQQIAKTDPRAEWYVEQAQEGAVALDVTHGSQPALSLAPWTGADLPGSIASTIKYRLVVTGAPGMRLALSASGLPKRWIGSFCTDRVCAPFRTSVVVPAGGVKVVEFQVVPTAAHKGSANVRIDAASGGRPVATVGTHVSV